MNDAFGDLSKLSFQFSSTIASKYLVEKQVFLLLLLVILFDSPCPFYMVKRSFALSLGRLITRNGSLVVSYPVLDVFF